MQKQKSRKKSVFSLRFSKPAKFKTVRLAAKLKEDSLNKFIERAAVKEAESVIADVSGNK